MLGLQKEVEGKLKEARGGILTEIRNLVTENIGEVSDEIQALATDVQFQLDNLSQVHKITIVAILLEVSTRHHSITASKILNFWPKQPMVLL